MPTVVEVRGRYRGVVRKVGFRPVSQTFDTEADAWRWGYRTEDEMAEGLYAEPDLTSFADAIDAYLKALSKRKPASRGKLALYGLLKRELGAEPVSALTAARIVRYGRTRDVSGHTLNKDLSYIRLVMRHLGGATAIKGSQAIADAAAILRGEGRLDAANQRDRRPSPEELTRLKAEFAATRRVPMGDIMDFAVATAMRAEEIASIRWADLNEQDRTVVIRNRKHPRKKQGNDQTVPVLDDAWAIIQRQPRTGDRIFDWNHKSWSSIFPRACKTLGIVDLRFHDLRHEGVSRLFELGYAIHEVALFSGHLDWAQLKRYTQLKASRLRRLTAQPSPSPPPAGASPAREF